MSVYSPARAILITAVITIGAFAIGYALTLASATGLLRQLEPRGGACRQIDGITGPEDIEIDYERGLAYITHADRFAVEHQNGSPRGDIRLLDLNNRDRGFESLSPLAADSFFPHGLSLWIGDTGERRLFVVNHGANGVDHSVEIFRIVADGRKLDHLRTIRHELLISPNDVAADGPESFYATNDVMSQSAPWRALEAFVQPRTGTVVHITEDKGRIAAARLRYANGIILGPDGEHVFAAAVTGRRIYAYERDPSTGKIAVDWVFDTPMGVDNLTLDPQGVLWAAGHPRPLEFTKHAKNPQGARSSSEVGRIAWQGTEPVWETVYLNRGEEVSGSSVAARFGERLLIGSVYESFVLDCEIGP